MVRDRSRLSSAVLLCVTATLAAVATGTAQTVPGEVDRVVIVGEGVGLLDTVLQDNDDFGQDLDVLGDLDGNGVVDLIVGAEGDDGSVGFEAHSGAVHVLLMAADGTLVGHNEIDDTDLAEDLVAEDRFGMSVATLGDLDGDGNLEVAVGVPRDDDGGSDCGAVIVISLDAAGQLVGETKLSNLSGGLGAVLPPGGRFGSAVEALGDLDGDGIGDLAVGSYNTIAAPAAIGSVRILFLNADATVKAQQLIAPGQGGFSGSAADQDIFGAGIAALGDVDGDGIGDLAVGAGRHDDFAPGAGAVWIFFLDTDGTLKGQQLIGGTSGGLQGQLRAEDHFGFDVAGMGDLDGDGIPDLAVNADEDGLAQGAGDQGTVWLLFLNADGTVKTHRTLGHGLSAYAPPLAPRGLRGGVLGPGDLDGDGHPDLITALRFFSDATPQPYGGRIHLTYLRPGHWRDLCLGLAGAEGIPSLDGAGLPLAGETVTLALHDVPSGALALLAVGATRVDLPLHGGTLVPSPDLVLGISVGNLGFSMLQAAWPAGVPDGFSIWLQAWYADAGGPFGYAASNGVVVTTP